ncbi:probable F-box protein At4g22030 [Rhododendron vialii]|uniref:probable F-box protein At4g22030 n=1 Tax=Rhododendron vialii TaxID=182163 RepID=UPI00265D9638|nr:probable F-box protein At4g22030 [Rhododendron vialii]
MPIILASNAIPSPIISSSSSRCRRKMTVRATINMPRFQNGSLSLPKLTTRGLELRSVYENAKTTTPLEKLSPAPINSSNPMAIAKLYAILEAVADRVEMHKNIGEQRNNWNTLLLTSINAITLTASVMTGVAAMGAGGAPLVALKLSSTLLYLAVTGMLLVMNKIQPSQLAEEQRNAARLFKKLYEEIHTTIRIGSPTSNDGEEAMEKVLALDRAYPLALLGVMLEKFPKTVEPAVWWASQQAPLRNRKAEVLGARNNGNGWNGELEGEMREIVTVLNRKDKEDYLRLGKKALKLNKILAISGPLLTGLAAFGSAFVGHGSWAVVLGVVAGALSTVVNTIEHGGQVGMVFEMYRSNAGFFELVQESIESNLKEREVERREYGELFEMKVALQLGRNLSELRDLATSSAMKGEANHEFASKLF